MGNQWASIVNFLIYLGISLPLLGVGIFLFLRTTPYNEFQIISGGADISDQHKVLAAQATAYDIGGKILGLAVVLASAIFHALNPLDLVIWGLIGAVFQVVVFYIFEFITPFKVIEEIPKGNVSVGIFSACMSVAAGLLLAALISY
jgi:putative membrane protein